MNGNKITGGFALFFVLGNSSFTLGNVTDIRVTLGNVTDIRVSGEIR